jgi:predicted nucleic acid-binding protein
MQSKYTYDTNIIKGYRIKRLPDEFYMSSVVLSELMTSAATDDEFRAYQATWRAHADAGTLLVPAEDDWLMASKVLFWLARDRRARGAGRAPKWKPAAKQELAMDVLLAVCARQQGVTVVTNDKDFDAIRYYLRSLRLKGGADLPKL